jgi:competence protein ComGC
MEVFTMNKPRTNRFSGYRGDNRQGITLVEILIYLFVIGVIVGGAYQGWMFFAEWRCNKNMSMLNSTIEQFITESRVKLTSLDDIKDLIKTDNGKFPHCGFCPPNAPYVLEPEERKVSCPYHGIQ